MRMKIPIYAKDAAKMALLRRKISPKNKKFGLSAEQASKLGINSGVVRAKQIVRSKSLSVKDVRRVAAFYQRFKNCRTPKCEGAIGLWGGRKFGRKSVSHLKKLKGGVRR
jgi:hypothetical protein